MSKKMIRRRRHDRLKRARTESRYRAEDMLFFETGRIPSSARAVCACPCGARAFSRVGGGDLDDFYGAHAYCDDYGRSE